MDERTRLQVSRKQVRVLAIGLVIGAALQVILQWPALRDMRLRPTIDRAALTSAVRPFEKGVPVEFSAANDIRLLPAGLEAEQLVTPPGASLLDSTQPSRASATGKHATCGHGGENNL